MIEALIVDDAPLNLKLLSVLLKTNGYVVQTAETAEAALALLASYTPRVLLVDIRLPGMDGLTLVRTLRAEDRHKDLTIVAVTASAMKGDEEIALAAGCDAYFTKPVDTRTLPSTLRNLLARKEAKAP